MKKQQQCISLEPDLGLLNDNDALFVQAIKITRGNYRKINVGLLLKKIISVSENYVSLKKDWN